MTASVSDYSWFPGYRRGSLSEMYCMTLIQGMAPDEFLRQLGAEPQGELEGFDALARRHFDFQEVLDFEFGDFMFLAATSVPGRDGSWTLAVEINGIVGVDSSLMAPVSTGRRVVSHFRNAKAMQLFYWWEDGDLRTSFEWPHNRSGSTPDDLLPAMAHVGYDLKDEAADPGVPGMLALAQQLTGVRVTPELLERAVYETGILAVTDEAKTSGWTWDRQDPAEAFRAGCDRHFQILVWAMQQGIQVNGPLPADVIARYEAAHPAHCESQS